MLLNHGRNIHQFQSSKEKKVSRLEKEESPAIKPQRYTTIRKLGTRVEQKKQKTKLNT